MGGGGGKRKTEFEITCGIVCRSEFLMQFSWLDTKGTQNLKSLLVLFNAAFKVLKEDRI